MKIIKYSQFINEELNDTPESYVSVALTQLKKKIDRMFDFQELEPDEVEPREEDKKEQEKNAISLKDAKKKGKEGEMTFKDLGVRLESSEVSKYSKMFDSLTVKFSDDSAMYNLLISIDIKEAIPKDPKKDFSFDEIENCYIKFKKYDLDTFEVIGQITKNAKISKIDEEFLIDLKIEIDDKFGEEEEFEIETE